MNENFNVETVADKVVESLSVATRQVIWIWAGTQSLDFIEALAFRIRGRGAFWMLRLTMETLLRRVGQHVPETYLAQIPEHELRWLDDVDAIIEVHDHGGHIPDVPLPRRRAMAAEWIALIDVASKRELRRLKVINPTPALALAYNVPLPILRRRYWPAINIDYTALDQQKNQVAGRVAEVEAPDPHTAVAFRELLAASAGDKDVIAEFALGLNPGVMEPVGDIMLDEKIGGNNQSDLHLDMVMLQPTVCLDGSIFVDKGVPSF